MRLITGFCGIVLGFVVCAGHAAPSNDPSDVNTPEQTEHGRAWQAYQQSVFDRLASSSDPHDWALSAIGAFFSDDNQSKQRANELLTRAAIALPDDADTQWLVLRGSNDTAMHATALMALERIEPDNAAVWAESLNLAAQKHDSANVDDALDRMAAGARFDEHLSLMLRRLVAAYLQVPPPPELIARGNESESSVESIADIAAISHVMAVALPAYQHLVRACTINAEHGLHLSHRADCGTIGRLLATTGSTIAASHVGFAILRTSHTWTDADAQRAREQDWLVSRLQTPAGLLANALSVVGNRYTQDWIATGSELGAMRAAVLRSGQSLTPSADWVDEQSPFSERRLQEDQKRAAERTTNSF